MNKNHYVAIMAGGIGSRFWPMSRESHPKQFLDILNSGKTLIQSTFERFAKFIPVENIYIVTSEAYRKIVVQQLPEISKGQIVCEPSRKNTAPCVALITYKLSQLNPQANLICAPADHLISDEDTFEDICVQALTYTENNKSLVTLGIQPTHPNTGFGYIQYDKTSSCENIFKVASFREKPNKELAESFLKSGEFLWNAGIFVWKVDAIISAFELFLPEMHRVFNIEKKFFNSKDEKEAIARIFLICENVSVDYGIMEKADNVYVIPSSFGWSDLGTWRSAYAIIKKDVSENALTSKDVIAIESSNNMIHAQKKKLLLLQGLDDFIIVDTPDVLMICKKSKEQEIKQYVEMIKHKKGDKFI